MSAHRHLQGNKECQSRLPLSRSRADTGHLAGQQTAYYLIQPFQTGRQPHRMHILLLHPFVFGNHLIPNLRYLADGGIIHSHAADLLHLQCRIFQNLLHGKVVLHRLGAHLG